LEKTVCIMTFHATYHALGFEKVLKEQNIDVKLIPVPRDLSSSCGSAARFRCQDLSSVKALVDEYCIEVDELYEREEETDRPGLLDRILRKK